MSELEENRFRLWKLYYSADAEGFIYLELTADQTKTRMYSFLGDPSEGEDDDIETPARERLRGLIFEEDKQDDKLDMEPLKVLIDICRDHDERYVDGSIQIAKVYKSGVSEFFGIYWPSIDGHPHFQGREFAAHERPDV